MTKNQNFIETKEYKRFAEFCDACIKYQYIGICYGQPGVGKLYLQDIIQIGILLKNKLIIEVGKI
ncbi:Uncharacterised protein [Streptococcus pneumoniae]|nr:Uncharacterised protein [Streptococcus pneumoniae]